MGQIRMKQKVGGVDWVWLAPVFYIEAANSSNESCNRFFWKFELFMRQV